MTLDGLGRSGGVDLLIAVVPVGDGQASWDELSSAGHRAYVADGIAMLENFLKR